MLNKILVVIGLASVIFLVVMMNLTTPSEVGPLGVLVFFTLMYAVCLSVTVGLCRLFFVIVNKFRKTEIRNVSKKSYYFGSVLAFAPAILIFMRSFGKLNLLEVALVGLFVLIGCFYISKKL